MISSLTVFWRERGVEGMGGKKRRGEGNGYPFPCWMFYKLRGGGISIPLPFVWMY